MILAKDVYLKSGYKMNQSVLVLGVPGSGKSRSHVLPNLCDMDSSFLVLDPKGELYDTARDMLRKRGYDVKCVDFDEPEKSEAFYNPLAHIKTEEDIIRLSELLLADMRKHSTDSFWADTSTILFNSLVSYLISECNPKDCTLSNIMKLLALTDASAHERGTKSTLDILFSDLEEKKPKHFAVQQYNLLGTCVASEKTYACIIMSLAAAFVRMMTTGMKKMTAKNTIDFVELGKTRTAIFVKSSDSDRSKDPLISIFFQQAFDTLYRFADSCPDHRLPVHVHAFMDDLGTGATVSRFDALIAGMRSREISCSVVLQSESQLKAMYGAAGSTILGSCQSFVFLGSNDLETCKAVSQRLNKPLDEVLYKKHEDIFVFTQGELPIKAKRYDLKSHKNYPLLNDPPIPTSSVDYCR